MDSVRLDILYAWRTWRREPGATVAAVLALALGIGANTAVFSVVSGLLLRPLPYPDPSRLVMAWQDRSATGGPAREVLSPGLFIDWATRATSLRGLAVIRGWSPNLTGRTSSGGDEPERLTGATVSGAYFSTLGIAPALGRVFSLDDDRFGAPTVVVLSDRLWRRRFASDRAIVGQSIVIDGQAVEVIGVMPASFRGAIIDADLWNTMRIDPANAQRGIVLLRAIARLAPDTTFDQAQAAMSTLQTQLQTEDPELTGARARLIRLHDDLVGPVRPVLIVLAGSVSMVLLIACANVTSLLLARAADRRAEMSLRVALGADRGRLARQLLVESSLLALAGSVAGLVLADVGVRALVAAAPPELPRLQDIQLDVVVLAFTAGITVFSAVVTGLVPALTGARASFMPGLREGIRDARGTTRWGAWLVAAEVAAAMILVVGAGLFIKSLIGLQRVDLGFRPDRLLTAAISPPRGAYRSDDATRELFDRLIARVAELPGVESATMTSVLPLSGMQVKFNFAIEGRPPGRTPDEDPVAAFRSVGTAFLSTMGMTLVNGRGFTSDDRAGAPAVAVASQTLVQRYWNGVAPIGARIAIDGEPATIIGVVADVRHSGPAAATDGEMYVPYGQLRARSGWLVLRTSRDPALTAPALRAAVREIDPNLALASVRPMRSLVEASVAQPRFLAMLLTWFSSGAALLALMGVYSLLTFFVSQRTREIGVRMALGASRGSVIALVLRQSLGVVSLGLAAGAAIAAVLSHFVTSLLFGVTPGDPETVAVMAGLILLASLGASALPARRAATVNPIIALRHD